MNEFDNGILVLPDSDFEDGDEYPDDAVMQRDIAEALAGFSAYERGETPLRVTQFAYGERIGPEMVTQEEVSVRQNTLLASSRLSYDMEADALHIRLQNDAPQRSAEIEPGVFLRYDAQNNLVGLDVLNLAGRLKLAAPEAV